MVERCKPANAYGLRGIAVCERWRNFANFLADMGERPTGCELDRINPHGNYEVGNCQWEPQRSNRQQKTTTKLTTAARDRIDALRARGWSHRRIAAELGVAKNTIWKYLNHASWSEGGPHD